MVHLYNIVNIDIYFLYLVKLLGFVFKLNLCVLVIELDNSLRSIFYFE